MTNRAAAARVVAVAGVCAGLAFGANLTASPMSRAFANATDGGDREMTFVAEQIRMITAEQSTDLRTKQAETLFQGLKKEEVGTISDADIDALGGMLADRDDSVRYWMAMALGVLGPRARRALPQLEQAFKEVACIAGSKTSASGIRVAFSRIGSAPPHVDCNDQRPDRE